MIGQATLIHVLSRARIARAGSARVWRVRTMELHGTKYRDNPSSNLAQPGAFDELGLGEPARLVAAWLVLDALHGRATGQNTAVSDWPDRATASTGLA